MNTVLEHLQSIDDVELRQKCLDNLDDRYINIPCYSTGMAIMIGVYQRPDEKKYWDDAYYYVNTGKRLTGILNTIKSRHNIFG